MNALAPAPTRLLRGYARFAIALVALFTITVLLPSTGREIEARSAARTRTETVAGVPGVSGPGAASVGGGTNRTAGGTAVARGACADRSTQIPNDPYSPPCMTFSGANGGATSKGVTKDTIKIGWRLTDETAAAAAARSLVGNKITIGDSREDVVRTIKGLTDYMNAHFQFYGRKLDMEVYDAIGSNTTENTGGGQDAANADAVTAANKVGAFADAGAESAVFSDGLARRGVIAIGISSVSDEWYNERGPYAWGTMGCTELMRHVAEFANKRLFGRPATDAGGSLAGKPRKIALIAPENPYYQDCVKRFQTDTAAAGNHVAEVLTYALDANTLAQDTSSMIAKMVQDNITSAILFTDPVSPLFLTAKASQQKYYPEWVVTGLALTDDDRIAQLYDQTQWVHAFGVRTLGPSVPRVGSIPYAAFKSVHPDQEPAGIALLFVAYQRLYALAAAIQMAGPNLTPQTFAAGWQSYRGGSGFQGTWRGQPNVHGLQVDVEEAFWDPNKTSAANDSPGAYVTTSPRLLLGQIPTGAPRVQP